MARNRQIERFFVWHDSECRFVEVDSTGYELVKQGVHSNEQYINNTIRATKDSDDDTTIWQFDVSIGGAFGVVITNLVAIVAELQGGLILNDGHLVSPG